MSLEPVTVRQLVRECLVAIRLEQHYKVSSICLHISRLLVELYDRELQDNEERDDELQEDNEDEDLSEDDNENDRVPGAGRLLTEDWKLVDAECRRLRHHSQIAEIYGDVLEFVRVRDLVCLGELVGANKRPDGGADLRPVAVELDIELLSKTLRQCIILLKELSQARAPNKETPSPTRGDLWISTHQITRLDSVSFPRHVIELADTRLESLGVHQSELASINSSSSPDGQQANGSSGSLLVVTEILRSKWFQDFSKSVPGANYPIDRFPVLVALWILAAECQHETLGQLMNELVDQIYHQEANSCNLDELMQLTQVGSFWISWKKRHLVTIKRQLGRPTSLAEDELDEEEDEEIESEDGSQSGRNNELDEDSERADRASAAEAPGKVTTKCVIFKPLLRSMIDKELLIGQVCLLCAREPSGDPLEPVQLAACPQCSLFSWPYSRPLCQSESDPLFCWLSFKPIQWLALGNLLRALGSMRSKREQSASTARLLLLTPNEYAQKVIDATRRLNEDLFKSTSQSGHDDASEPGAGRERIDISEKFERLRVLRNDSGEMYKTAANGRPESSASSASDVSADDRRRENDRASQDFENFSQDYAQELRDDDDELSHRKERRQISGEIYENASEVEEEEEEEAGEEEGDDGEANKRERQLELCLSELAIFLETRARLAHLAAGQQQQQQARANYYKWLQLSESLQLLKVAFRHGALSALSSMAAVYSGDVVVLDSMQDERLSTQGARLLSLYLVSRGPPHASSAPPPSDRSSGACCGGAGQHLASGISGTSQPVYACRVRSRTSSLQLGCGRLFNPLDLIRAGCSGAGDSADSGVRSRRLAKYSHWPRVPSDGAAGLSGAGSCDHSAVCPACKCQLVAMRPGRLCF